MKRLGIIALILGTMVSYAGPYDPDKTNGIFNGRAWQKWPELHSGYVVGYFDGLRLGMTYTGVEYGREHDAVNELYPLGMTGSEMTSAVDQFYEDPLNARIAIPYAIGIVRDRFKGVEESVVQEHIRSLRQLANQ